jgi:hypothetical protein
MIDPGPIRDRFSALSPHLNERERRLFAATEAAAAGYGGIAAVSAATGIAVSTIGRGLKGLAEASGLVPGRVRRAGGGCQSARKRDPRSASKSDPFHYGLREANDVSLFG